MAIVASCFSNYKLAVNHNCMLIIVLIIAATLTVPSSQADLSSEFYSTSHPEYVQFVDGGEVMELKLDQTNASSCETYDSYLFGVFTMQMKLVPGNSAGTVTTYYMSSMGPHHDELDVEFLGNVTGQPIVLQTNVFSNGVGAREQRMYLWFDPTADFHNYTLIWNHMQVVFLVDGVPIRVFPNVEAQTGVPYLLSQHMKAYASLWDGDSWATEGGRIKVDWTQAPFVASYRGYSADACGAGASATSASECAASRWWGQIRYQALDEAQLGALQWVKQNYMIYDYCTDKSRYEETPPECFYTTPVLPPPSPAASPAPSPSVTVSTVSSSPSPSANLPPSNSRPDIIHSPQPSHAAAPPSNLTSPGPQSQKSSGAPPLISIPLVLASPWGGLFLPAFIFTFL